MTPSTLLAEPVFDLAVLRDGSVQREACDRELAAAGVQLPLPHRAGWARVRRGVEALCVALRDTEGRYVGAFGLHSAASRALPGFRLLRVERFGEAIPRTVWASAVEAIEAVARRERRVLRVTVEVFSRDGETRLGLGRLLSGVGFERAATVQNWGTTLALDLGPSQDDLFASFSPNARRAIRAPAKVALQVHAIDDARFGDRLEALSRETFARTGVRYRPLWNWMGVIEVSMQAPDASRLVGLFRTDQEGPEALLGFAWGWWNGRSASYFAGGSSRPSDLGRVSVMHSLLWDLITWAKRAGAEWFDLGGVTAGTAGSSDPLGGISDFKRLFSRETVEVAEDWVFEPRRGAARVAALVSTGAAWLARIARH